MNVLLDPDMTLRDFVMRNFHHRAEDGSKIWIPIDTVLCWDGDKGLLCKVDPLDVPDEVVEALKLDSVL
jgi:hypothetical protein